MKLYEPSLLQFVQCSGYVESGLAKYGCKAFHLYIYLLYAALCLATHGYELYYAPYDAGGGVVPDEFAILLGFAADEVEEVDGEYVVFGEFREKVLLGYGEDGAVVRCRVAAFEGCVVTEQRIGLDGVRGRYLLFNAVSAVWRGVGAAECAAGEYGKMVALVSAVVNGVAFGVFLEFKCGFAKYGCYVVSAHALKIG